LTRLLLMRAPLTLKAGSYSTLLPPAEVPTTICLMRMCHSTTVTLASGASPICSSGSGDGDATS
jgi:hypothetical protein